MMKPEKSYRIWFSNRNGSTLLCQGLEQTGIAGKPGEYFNLMESTSLCEKYGVQTYEDLKYKLWELGTSANGVFGIKHTNPSGHRAIFDEIRRLRGISEGANITTEELLADLFPNCKHIYLTRRNKVRQAVSWWKAIQDNVWHLEAGQEHRNDETFYEQNYNFAALSHLFTEATLRECDIQEHFSTYKIQPLTLVYEDFVVDFGGTLRQIVDYLEIEYDKLSATDMFYVRTANAHSEKWVQRFRAELQQGWDNKIW